jgi:hypothetical protein
MIAAGAGSALLLVLLILFGSALVATAVVWLTDRFWLRPRRAEALENLVLLQVLVPKVVPSARDPQDDQRKDFRELIAVAEQLFSSLSGTYRRGLGGWLNGQPRFSFEIIAKDGQIRFYVGVPRALRAYVEKQIQGFYPDAHFEANDGFVTFVEGFHSVVAVLHQHKQYFLPLKTYKLAESEPLNGITNAMEKLGEHARASVQLLVEPRSDRWRVKATHAAKAVAEGRPILTETSVLGKALYWLSAAFHAASRNTGEQMSSSNAHLYRTPIQEQLMKLMQEKASKVGFRSQLRVTVTSQTMSQAESQLQNLIHAFSQYTLGEGNRLDATSATTDPKLLTAIALREFAGPVSLFNTEELASLFHLPTLHVETPTIQWLPAKILPPPPNLPETGVVLGKSVYRGVEQFVRLQDDDRRRHLYMIGKTGVGKTTAFLTMIEQDIKEGKGVCYIDPNGDAILEILQRIPRERAEDVILFDPSDAIRPMGLNMLEWKRPEDRDFLVAEWLEIFYKLFDPNRTGMVGPQFEHWGRNASLTVMSLPGGGTLIDIPRLFTDDGFREYAVSHVTDPVVLAFWNQQLAKTADFHKSEMFNYFISKFGRFMTNDLVRNIIGQPQSSFDVRDIIDSGKIFLVNLSKGKIGETNSFLLGMILVSKLQVAAFSRADSPEEGRRDFYLYVDEFQNFTTGTFKTILSEARKYHLDLAITNQYIAQLPEDIRDAVIGNAGTLISFRIGAQDAEFVAKEFPSVSEHDLVNLTFATTYAKLLVNGTPTRPFSMRTIKSERPADPTLGEAIRQLSRLKHGRAKDEVEADFARRLTLSAAPETPPLPSLPPREA